MPEICYFDGIHIRMRTRDHAPPHFHVESAGSSAAVEIRTLRLLEGSLPPRILRKVLRWAAARQVELLEDWALLRAGEPARPIAPLE